MTTSHTNDHSVPCPVKRLLKLFSGKLKPEIFLLATESSLRFNTLLREIKGANKQSLAIALKDLTEADVLEKVVVRKKPLHIEYYLTEKGKSIIPLFEKLEEIL